MSLPSASSTRNRALERAIENDPRDPEVYADWRSRPARRVTQLTELSDDDVEYRDPAGGE